LETWTFPDTPERIWNSLKPARQDKIVRFCATSPHVRNFKPLIEYLAERRHTREQTILKWPSSKFETAIRGMMRGNYETSMVLAAYVFEGREKITSAIETCADRLDIDEDGTPRPESLEGAVASLLKVFPHDEVQLCLQVHYAMGRRQLWMHLPEIDFARVEQHMQEPDEQPETEDEIEEEMDEENEGEIDSEVSEAQGQAAGETPPAPVVSGSDDSALRLQTLTGRIEDLRTRFAEISAQYSSFASDFANGVIPNLEGEPDPYELQDEFGEVADAIETLLTVLKLPGFSEPPASLSVFDQAMQDIQREFSFRENSRKQMDAACRILDIILALRSKDGRELPGLATCQHDATDLRSKILQHSGPELPAEILNELSLYEAIVNILQNETAALDVNPQTFDQIAKSFGASLVFAIGSGALVVTEPTVIPNLLASESTSEFGEAHDDQRPATTAEPAFANVANQRAPVDPPAPEAPPESLVPATPSPAREAVPNLTEKQKHTESRKPTDAPPEQLSGARAPVPPQIVTAEQESQADLLADESDDESDDAPDRSPAQSGFQPCKNETVALCAAVIRQANGHVAGDSLQRLMWVALSERRFGVAYHLARSFEDQTDPSDIWSTRLRAAILGQAIANPSGSIFEQLRTDFAMISAAGDPDSRGLALAFRLLMVGSALRAAVLSPASNASVLIERGTISGSRLDKLYIVCKKVSDYANLQMPLDLAALEFIDTSVNLDQRIAALKSEAAEWWGRAPSLQFKYAPAAKIWKSWLEPKEPVGQLIQPILAHDRNKLASVKAQIESLSTDEKIRNAINTDAKSIKQHYRFVGSINYNALSVFTRHVREAVDLARRWAALIEHSSPDQNDYRRSRLLELRTTLDSARPDLKTELDQAAASATDMRVAVAARFCAGAFESLLALLHSGGGQRSAEPPIKYLLSSNLLLIPGLPMTEAWDPRLSFEPLRKLLVSHCVSLNAENWERAFDFIGENTRDHEAVDRIIEYLSWEKGREALAARLTAAQDQHLKQCQSALKRQIDETARAIEAGVSLGHVRDHERADFLDRIDQISSRLLQVRNFEAEEDVLKGIYAAIDNSRMRQIEQVKERIESESVPKEGPAYQRILAAMDRGDVDTAHEYIDLGLRNDELPAPVEQVNDTFNNFYPKATSELEKFLSAAQPPNLAAFVENGKSFPGVDMRSIPGAQLDEAVGMLDAWFVMKRARRGRTDPIRTFFERLGFEVFQLSEPAGTQRVVMTMDARTLTHRDRCPVPYFGSTAGGRYRVICLWDRPSEDEILDVVRQGRNGPPAIVLYFGRLSDQKRRGIAQQGRKDNLSFIVIDELLVAFLCGVRGSRLPVMFDCTLPFTCLNPYTMTSSIVPPEMFYGRRAERDQIIDPLGSCFVYGGRQLGKTALLLSIRDEFHQPADQRLALWIDLKSSTNDIWAAIARGIKDMADADLQIGNVQEKQKLLEKIQAWLDADKKRRFLLLLDEADRFLELDSKEDFSRTSSLKGLMEKTNRRFKVVFAGLHNVQRATKEQNHPLAHFGEPICIGPLLNRGEGKEARSLIERPFWALGYRFESPDLIVRILSRTNYYPSLIQLYCYQIFQAIKLDNACIRSGPPFVITAKHVDEAYSSFQNPIREKFELTLNLDPRYRVLALLIALHTLQGTSRMISVGDIRELAFSWWKQGFAELRTEEDFRVLLDEMQGLGILREKAGEYALRAVNLLSLLGSQEQIEQKLLQSADEAPPEPYSAHIHRTSDRKQYWKRNPLTDQQYYDLRGERNCVSLIFGSRAAGLDDVDRFVAQAVDSTHFITCEIAASDRFTFRKFLEETREKSQGGTTIILVRNSPWTAAWIQEATTMSKGRTRFTSVVFLADPAAAWGLASDRAVIEPMIADRRLSSISLQPWHRAALNSWLGDCSIGSNALEEEKKISAATGSWPFLLEQFRGLIVTGGMNWQAALENLRDQLNDSGLRPAYLEAFGLKLALPAKVLKAMVDLGGAASMEVLTGLVDGVSRQECEAAFYWADRLTLIQPGLTSGEWVVDPVVQDLLKAQG
jgi:hypothetical protein